MFKNISFRKRIMGAMLLSVALSQILLVSVSYVQLIRINKFTDKAVMGLGNYTLSQSKEALQNNSKSYLDRLNKELANSTSIVLKNIEEQVKTMALAMKSVYSDPSVPEIKDISFDMEKTFDSRESVKLRSFAVDRSSSKEDGSLVLAYDNGLYNNTYSTTVESWVSTTEDKRQNIDEKNAVVSKNKIPDSLERQMNLLNKSIFILKPIYTYSTQIDSVYYGTESGIVGMCNMGPIKQFYEPRIRNWYKDAVNKFKEGNDEVCWQPAYVSASDDKVCITCSKAFTDSSGNLAGVVASDIFYDSVARNILDLKIGNTGSAFIIDKDANIVIDKTYTQSNDFSLRNILDEEIDESLRSSINKMKDMQSGVEEVKIKGNENYLVFSPIEVSGWSLGIVVDKAEVVEPAVKTGEILSQHINSSSDDIDNMTFFSLLLMTVIIIISSVIVLIISIVLARKISEPVLELADIVSKVGEKGLPEPIEVKSKDELGLLSEAFNKMTESIKHYVSDLEITIGEKHKIHAELNVAKRIQAGMLPSIFPAFPTRNDFDIYATMEPAKEVGGDFYDFFFVDKDNLAMVIADVSGKGVSAALFMVISKTLIKNEVQSGLPINEALNNVNKKLCENNDEGMFVTAFVAVFNIPTGELKFSNAGHNPPLIYRKRDDKFYWLKMKKGFVLAGLDNIKYELQSTYMDEGDLLYLYTDGVTEAVNKNNELFSELRLLSIMSNPRVKTFTLKEVLQYVRGEIDLFANGAAQADDITMLAFKNIKIDIDDDKY